MGTTNPGDAEGADIRRSVLLLIFVFPFYCYYKEALRHITRLYEHFECKTTAITESEPVSQNRCLNIVNMYIFFKRERRLVMCVCAHILIQLTMFVSLYIVTLIHSNTNYTYVLRLLPYVQYNVLPAPLFYGALLEYRVLPRIYGCWGPNGVGVNEFWLMNWG